MGGYPSESCHRLPFDLSVCPTCGHGVKRSRGWTWIDGVALFGPSPECLTFYKDSPSGHCESCVVCSPNLLIPQREFEGEPPAHFGMSGLIWIGERFYATPESFATEASNMGVSRRIHAVPNGFVLGETWVFFAHSKTVPDEDNPSVEHRRPGIFQMFKPSVIEYVVKGDESKEELARLEERGIDLVDVQRDDINMDFATEWPDEWKETEEKD